MLFVSPFTEPALSTNTGLSVSALTEQTASGREEIIAEFDKLHLSSNFWAKVSEQKHKISCHCDIGFIKIIRITRLCAVRSVKIVMVVRINLHVNYSHFYVGNYFGL